MRTFPQRPAAPGSVSRRCRGAVLGPALALALALALTCLGTAVPAATGPRDLQLIARVMGFLAHPPGGDVEIGIVYPAQSAAGRAEAEQLVATVPGGVRAGNLVLRPRLLTLEEASRAAPPALLLTEAALSQAGALAAALAGRGVLIVSPDPASVDAAQAVVALRSQPRVEILVSRAAAQRAGLEFASAFRMLIQER
ncbi:YfiR/HmsC family protein [Rhodovastum atsumiense]|uniref:DUF4154 domain-containing protein n=1 Tax=Rhodovastum atsumiense TaxID=504468 RepID=A0A5M6IQ61_9PROT|nr:YfiR/HmsC family protein [Rhodovastum atsumiense]KAA5610410.1 DUF4154 domain-containing protein [Rhodovastum atsumiense]